MSVLSSLIEIIERPKVERVTFFGRTSRRTVARANIIREKW